MHKIDYVVLAEYEGKVRQVLLTKTMEKHIGNLIFQMFFEKGDAVKLMDPPLKGVSFQKPKED